MLDESEGAGDFTVPLGTKDDFFHHELRPPLSSTLKRKKRSDPSLQDCCDTGAFGHGAVAGTCCVLPPEGSSPCVSDSNPDFVRSSTGGFPAAISVVLYAGIGNKKPLAIGIGASDLLAHGFCLQGKTITLFRGAILGKNKNQIKRRWVISLLGEGKNIQGWDFLTDQP